MNPFFKQKAYLRDIKREIEHKPYRFDPKRLYDFLSIPKLNFDAEAKELFLNFLESHYANYSSSNLENKKLYFFSTICFCTAKVLLATPEKVPFFLKQLDIFVQKITPHQEDILNSYIFIGFADKINVDVEKNNQNLINALKDSNFYKFLKNAREKNEKNFDIHFIIKIADIYKESSQLKLVTSTNSTTIKKTKTKTL